MAKEPTLNQQVSQVNYCTRLNISDDDIEDSKLQTYDMMASCPAPSLELPDSRLPSP